ncbi:uncharacterized protein PGTG_21588 [Puccinia graminis f. sp. tritici CRL 75-36-700-3]|uniref:Tc1-like transposase DDE domain-containing protein n=1 Tax=Puccinia graminis f. sp. tritici (strain CRL 75-36-700-3 / race SCCL) TaxID=418459 RepID=H6QRX3_PUCGT|nr:uncharacterized protein PGTG_21588 [Puccinia graminis f. sp. tritici CRL 75-36-700-3]EHS63457.1 hypothetical protein PGTG_21588 [Puccinia graminis f. sp. tritici CRL 75-36-700-3]
MSLRGETRQEINETLDLKISADSIRRWNQLYERTRSVIRNPAFYQRRGRPIRVSRDESQFIMDALDLEPTLYLDEIRAHIDAMTGERHPIATIHNEIKYRLRLTCKKARTVHPAQCALRRAAFVSQIGFIPSNHLVFLDETGVSIKTHSRDHAYALKGRRTVRLPRPITASRISVLPAVSLDGLLAVIAQEGTMYRLDLEYFLEEFLSNSFIELPNMNPFPDRNSVLVLDNASLHHGGGVARLCEDRGVLLVYLPPYSPDMNPIEKVFSVLKSQLKRRQILTGTVKDIDIIKDVLPEIVTPELMASLFRGSNYAA